MEKSYYKKAFTLIEIIIVVALIALMATISVPAFNRYNQRNHFEAKSEEITTLFNRAYALSVAPKRVEAGSNSYTCDAVNVVYNGSKLTLMLKRTVGSEKVDCSETDQDIDSEVIINDDPSLDVLALSGVVVPFAWTFESFGKVNFDLDGAGFNLHSNTFESEDTSFYLNKSPFSIKIL